MYRIKAVPFSGVLLLGSCQRGDDYLARWGLRNFSIRKQSQERGQQVADETCYEPSKGCTTLPFRSFRGSSRTVTPTQLHFSLIWRNSCLPSAIHMHCVNESWLLFPVHGQLCMEESHFTASLWFSIHSSCLYISMSIKILKLSFSWLVT